METKFYHILRHGTLFLWGGVLLYFFTTGRVIHYLSDTGGFRIQTLVAGLLLLVIGLFNLLQPSREITSHGHPFTLATFLMLALPIAAAALLSPDKYSEVFRRNKLATARILQPAASSSTSLAWDTAGTFTLANLEALCDGRSTAGHLKLRLNDAQQMIALPANTKTLITSQTFELAGQAALESPTRVQFFLLQMTCCAADARPISVSVDLPTNSLEVRDMGYYRAVGKVEFREENGHETLVFVAEEITPDSPPRNGMMF